MNFTKNAVTLVAVGLVFALTSSASAQTSSRYIPYKGQIERDGVVFTGRVNISFELWDAPSGGTILHTEVQSVTVTAGQFSVRIGPIADTVFNNPNLYIGLVVEGTPLGGRQIVQTTPYAVRGQPGQPFRVDSLVVAPSGGTPVTLGAGTNGAALAISGGDIEIDGNINTPRLSAFNVIANANTSNFAGGFFQANFSDPGGTLLIHASASAYCTAAGRIAMNILVDGTVVSRMRTYCHVTGQHIVLPSTFFELSRGTFVSPPANAPVTRTLRIEPINCTSGCASPLVTTSADANDFVEATIVRLPAY